MSTARSTTWLVTGANRGIGLEIVRQLLESPNNVVAATTRNPEKSSGLDDLKKTAKERLHIVKLDVGDFDSVRASVKDLQTIFGETGLDYLINNAGIAAYETPFNMDPEQVMHVLKTNAVGPALVSQVALPFLEKGAAKKILHISSTGGSVGSADMVGSTLTPYAMSKAALNMLAYKQKLDRPEFVVITLCPGWVKTDMGGQDGQLEPRESVAGILKVITTATTAESGKFLKYDGKEIPW